MIEKSNVTLDDEHLACLRTVRAMMELNGAPSPSDGEVLTRALAVAADIATGKMIHELGREETAVARLRALKAYPYHDR